MSRCIVCNECPEVDHDVPYWSPKAEMYWDDTRHGFVCGPCLTAEYQTLTSYEEISENVYDEHILDPTFDEQTDNVGRSVLLEEPDVGDYSESSEEDS